MTEPEPSEIAKQERTSSRAKLRIDRGALSVWVDDRRVSLTSTEFLLLTLLAGQPERTFTRDELLGHADPGSTAGVRTIDVHVAALRRKLGHPQIIATIRGAGYRWAAADDRPDDIARDVESSST